MFSQQFFEGISLIFQLVEIQLFHSIKHQYKIYPGEKSIA